MDYRINNAEFVLLLLISEVPNANGYRLRNIVAQRGMEAWAGVSSSSIYVVLKKLEARCFVDANDDLEKKTKGPRGKVFLISPDGKVALISAIENALSECREHDQRFNIALSGIECLGLERSKSCLQKRYVFLGEQHQRLFAEAAAQPALPLAAKLLFDRIRHGINAERNWLEKAISQIPIKG